MSRLMSNVDDDDDGDDHDDSKSLLSIYHELGTRPISSHLLFLLLKSAQHFGRPPSKGRASVGWLLG